MDRNELLRDRIRENKYPQTVLVSTWHPKLSAIPSILKHNLAIPNCQKFSNRNVVSPTKKTNPFQITF